MKKMMSLIVAVAMISNTAFATTVSDNASHDQMIAKTFNQFRYNMTASADATSPSFKAQAVTEFKARMADLQASGVSADEIMSYMRANILDASTRADFDRMMTSVNASKMSSEDAGNLAMQFMASKYQQGASYSGGGKANLKIAAIIIGIVIVGVVTYFVVKCHTNTNTTTTTTTSTGTTTQTQTQTNTDTVTNTDTNTDTVTITETNTDTFTYTDTSTGTCYDGNYAYPCNYGQPE